MQGLSEKRAMQMAELGAKVDDQKEEIKLLRVQVRFIIATRDVNFCYIPMVFAISARSSRNKTLLWWGSCWRWRARPSTRSRPLPLPSPARPTQPSRYAAYTLTTIFVFLLLMIPQAKDSIIHSLEEKANNLEVKMKAQEAVSWSQFPTQSIWMMCIYCLCIYDVCVMTIHAWFITCT